MSPFTRLRSFRRRTWVLITLAAVVVIGATVTIVLLLNPVPSEAQEVSTTSTAGLSTLDKTVDATGTVSPSVVEDLEFTASGTVQSVDVVAGQSVEAGQVLGTIDTLQADADVARAKADLADAQAELDSAETSAAVTAANAAVAVAQRSVTEAESARAGTTLVATVAGIVTVVGVETGDVVGSTAGATDQSASTQSTSTQSTSTAAFTIVGRDAWSVTTSVGEADVPLLAADNQVELAMDDGTELYGVVTTIGLLPSTTSGSAEYPVTIQITGDAENLFDGISVSVSIVYERRVDVLTVPSAAVTTTAEGVSTVQLMTDDGSIVETTVEIGETVGELTEIVSGIAEGDQVSVVVFTPGEGNTGGGTGGREGGFPGFTEGEVPQFPGDTMPGGGTEGTR